MKASENLQECVANGQPSAEGLGGAVWVRLSEELWSATGTPFLVHLMGHTQ